MMTKDEIVDEISKLPHGDRREILSEILGMEPDSEVYEEATRSADEAFLMLDELERQDVEPGKSR